MVTQLHRIDRDTCNGDGLCASVCPRDVLDIADGIATTVESRAESCITCGQCVAVCPAEAIRHQAMPDEDFERLARPSMGFEQLHGFLRTRRSVRSFKAEGVAREDIDRILLSAATAPMGFPPHTTQIVVVDDPDERRFLLEALVTHYDGLIKAFSNPIGRGFLRLVTGSETYGVLRDHVVESATRANEAFRRDGTDRYLYGAPVVMLFHASRWGASYEENAHLVCHHAVLAALSLGLGSTIIGMVPPVVERSEVLRGRYGIPADHRVLTSLILGHPKVRYRRSIRRELAGVQYNRVAN